MARVRRDICQESHTQLQHNISRCWDNDHTCRSHLGKSLGDRGLVDTSASTMHKRHLRFSKNSDTLGHVRCMGEVTDAPSSHTQCHLGP